MTAQKRLAISSPSVTTSQDRRFSARSQAPQKDQELVRHFVPGRIPVLLRQANAEKLHRAMDVLGAIVGLILFAPLLIPSMILVKATSKGPVFFSQIRVGRGGKLFRMYKLRTMVTNAEKLQKDLMALNEQKGSAFKMKNDPRVTSVGKWLRRFSLDEVPQFLNVLRGEMSLVGPRPPLPREVESYKRWQLQRLMVKPGLTGLWQISGRNRLDFDDWVRLDIRYIKQRNLRFDIEIMFRTFKVLFFKPNGQ
jgi:lipopolysaccharide/colanic/teichoic acid biosynthesis glycosyltransferase